MPHSDDPENPILTSSKDETMSFLADELLSVVRENGTKEEIKELISKDPNILRHRYPPPYDYQTILMIACNDKHSMKDVTKKTIKTLIKLGADSTEISKSDRWQPIHYTAINANKAKMTAIIKHLSQDQLNSLVCCSKRIAEKYNFCTTTEIQETYSNNALHVLLKLGKPEYEEFWECSELLKKNGIDVNQPDSNGITPSDLIQKLKCGHLPKRNFCGDLSKNCFGLLRLGDIDGFLSVEMTKEEANSCDGKNEILSSCTLLQMCCAKGFTPCVSKILEAGASPNDVIWKNPKQPIMIAIDGNHEEIVKLFLKRNDAILPADVILTFLQMLYKNKENNTTVDKYMKMVLKYIQCKSDENFTKYLVVKDDLERTALHYAVLCKCSDTTLALLSMGASLTKKDVYGYSPLESIESAVLENFLDSCVTIVTDDEDSSANQIKTHHFATRINYKNLVAIEAKAQESDFLKHMVSANNLNYLLNHPVVAIYLTLKWSKYKWFVYFNLLLYCVAYIYLLVEGVLRSRNGHSYKWILLTVSVVLLFRIIVNILIYRFRFFKKLETVSDLVLIFVLIYVMILDWNNQNNMLAYSVVFLISTLAIFNQLGTISHFAIKVEMLKQVAVNFFKAMAFYMIPVLAFLFCFCMLRKTDTNIFKIFYHTITMYAGDSRNEFPKELLTDVPFDYVVYLVFVVLICLILHNLLIGLAVSDLQNIQKQVEFISKKEQAKYIFYVEHIIFNQLKNKHRFKSMFRYMARLLKVFEGEAALVIEFNESNCMYVKEGRDVKMTMQDMERIKNFHHILKNLTLKHKRLEDIYSLKSIHEKITNLETVLYERIGNLETVLPERIGNLETLLMEIIERNT